MAYDYGKILCNGNYIMTCLSLLYIHRRPWQYDWCAAGQTCCVGQCPRTTASDAQHPYRRQIVTQRANKGAVAASSRKWVFPGQKGCGLRVLGGVSRRSQGRNTALSQCRHKKRKCQQSRATTYGGRQRRPKNFCCHLRLLRPECASGRKKKVRKCQRGFRFVLTCPNQK